MTSEYQYNLVPFQEIKRFWDYRDQLGILSFTNLAGNILIFVPFGFLEAIVMKNRRNLLTVTLDGFLISLFVEVSQLVMMVGCFDVDDLILNTMGTMIGYILFKSCNTMRRRYGEKRTGK